MPTTNLNLRAVKPSGVLVAACPSSFAGPGLRFVAASALSARQWSADSARPAAAAGALGSGYGPGTERAAVRPAGARPRGAADAQRIDSSKQDLFHQMSRRDSRSWRPPA